MHATRRAELSVWAESHLFSGGRHNRGPGCLDGPTAGPYVTDMRTIVRDNEQLGEQMWQAADSWVVAPLLCGVAERAAEPVVPASISQKGGTHDE